MEGRGRERAEDEEEEILVDDGLLGEAAERGGFRGWGGLSLDARPGQVDVEEEEEDAEADYGGLDLRRLLGLEFPRGESGMWGGEHKRRTCPHLS